MKKLTSHRMQGYCWALRLNNKFIGHLKGDENGMRFENADYLPKDEQARLDFELLRKIAALMETMEEIELPAGWGKDPVI